MAENTVIVPIELSVTDIRMEDVDLKDVKQSVIQKLATIADSASEVLGKIDTSKLNKALLTSMDKVKTSYQKLYQIQSKFDDALANAGSSSKEYKAEYERVQSLIDIHKKRFRERMEDYKKDAKLRDAIAKREQGLPTTREEDSRLYAYDTDMNTHDYQLKNLQSQLPKPKDYIGSATSTELQKIIDLYHNMFNAVDRVETATRGWNETVKNNQMTDEYTKKLSELESYEKKLDSIKAKAQKMSELGATSSSWKNLTYDANLLEEKIKQVIADLQEMLNTGNAFRFDGGDTAEQLAIISERAQGVTESITQIRDTPQTVNNSVKGMAKTINSFCVSAKKGLANVISMFRKLGKTGNSTNNSMGKSMKKLWKDILMFGFGIRSTYFLVRRLRNMFVESFKEMSTQIPEVNTQISSFVTALNQLKGSIATAFQPIVSAAIPWLNQLIAALSNAMTALGRFFATLTGQGYIYKFTAAQVDYAKSLDKTAGSAKKAQKSLMGFDEINRLDADSGSGGGSGDTPTGTWEKETLNGMSSLAEMIKEAWSTGDFYEVGQYIGEQLLGALTVADNWILNEGYAYAEKIGNSIATLINGFVETDKLGSQIGKTIVDAINMAIIGVEQFLSTVNWSSIGQFIADGLNSIATNFKADKLGQSITHYIRGILTLLTTAINNTDWSTVGSKIGELLSNINWSGIFIDFTKLVGAIVKGLAEAFVGWSATDPLSAGIATMLGLAFGALNLGATITGLILKFAPLIGDAKTLGDAFKVVIGAVKKWAPTFGGIIAIVSGAITFVTNFIAMLENGFNWVNEALMLVGAALVALGVMIFTGPSLVVAVIAAIVAAIATIVVVVKDNWNEIVAFVKAIPGWVMDNIITPVVNFFKTLGTTIVQLLSNAWTTIKNVWNVVASWFTSTVLNPLKTGFQNAIKGITGFFSSCWSNIKSVWGSVKTWFTNVANGIKTAFNNAINGVKKVFSGLWSGVKSGCKSAFNTVISFIERGINNLIKGINKVIKGINKLAGGAAKLAGLSFSGIPTVPTVSLPRLAKGGVIPPNNEFMAILGDQKHGTNIEAPLDTIKQAVAEELAEYIDAMMVGFQAVVDAVNDKDLSVRIGDKEIGKAAERYSTRQALIRGV